MDFNSRGLRTLHTDRKLEMSKNLFLLGQKGMNFTICFFSVFSIIQLHLYKNVSTFVHSCEKESEHC